MIRKLATVLFVLSFLIADCLSQDLYANITQLIQEAGYPAEDHWVQTSDGFLLSVVRIPHGRNNKSQSPKPVAFLQHGLLDTGATWILNPPDEGLGFILADAGFDVYLGNVRGNTYSNRNVFYSNDSKEFWDLVDWDNMISIDLPAMLNLALEISGQSTLVYVGHSQGTLMGFGGFPLDTELASKVDIFIALAPVAFVSHQESILLTFLADLDLADVLSYFGELSFLPSDWLIELLGGTLCEVDPTVCADVIFLLCGTDRSNLNNSRIPLYMTHTPGGTSVRNMVHWSQAVNSGKFQMYDYGTQGNLQHYNQSTPPLYDLDKLTSPPIAFFTGTDDDLADPTDVQLLLKALPAANQPVVLNNQPTYEHLDFTWGENAYVLIYPEVVKLAQQYSSFYKNHAN